MIVSHRVATFPGLAARFEQHQVFDSRFRVKVERMDGLRIDDAMLPPNSWLAEGPAFVCVGLEGAGQVTVGGGAPQRMSGGWATLVRSTASGYLGRVESSRSRVLSLAWDPGWLGAAPTVLPATSGPFDARDLARIGAVSNAIERCGDQPARLREPVRALFEVLAANGLVPRAVPAGELGGPEPAPMVRLAASIDAALCRPYERAAASDLERALGLSDTHTQRLMSEFARRYVAAPGSWRELSRRWRLALGLALMTAEGATTDAVARVLGYASPTAFCRAFAMAGMPSPGRVRRAFVAA